MPPPVRSLKGRLNFFSDRAGLRINPPIRPFEVLRISPGKRTSTERPCRRLAELTGKINIQMQDYASRIGDIHRPGTCEINC